MKQQVVELGLENEQEYYEGLALAEQQKKTIEFYEREIQKGLDSLNDGPFIEITPEYWKKWIRKSNGDIWPDRRRRDNNSLFLSWHHDPFAF